MTVQNDNQQNDIRRMTLIRMTMEECPLVKYHLKNDILYNDV